MKFNLKKEDKHDLLFTSCHEHTADIVTKG